MTRTEATQIVLEELVRVSRTVGEELVVLDEHTIEKPYGWIFFYNTRRYVETGDFIYGLGGNGPLVVESSTGRISRLGTARPLEDEIAAYEARHDQAED
jgi:hypothetical protein